MSSSTTKTSFKKSDFKNEAVFGKLQRVFFLATLRHGYLEFFGDLLTSHSTIAPGVSSENRTSHSSENRV